MEKTLFDKSTKTEKLRINIDSKWSVHDFSFFFRTLENLYALYVSYHEGMHLLEDKKTTRTSYIHKEHTPLAHFVRNQMFIRSMFSDEGIYDMNDHDLSFSPVSKHWTRLDVASIQYSSPGFTDIVGLSGILGHVKEVLMYYFPNKEKKEEIRIKEQERIRIQIQNLKDMGLSSIEIQKVILLEDISLAKVKLLIDTGKITSIEFNDN